jgi:hypothetical protein
MNRYTSLGEQIESTRKDYLNKVISDNEINNLEKIQIITDNLLFGNDSINGCLSHPLNIFIPEIQQLVKKHCQENNISYVCTINDDLLIDIENSGRGATVLYYDILSRIIENLEYDNEELDIDWDNVQTYQLYDNSIIANLEIPIYQNRGDGDIKLSKPLKLVIDTIYEYMIKNKQIGFKIDW